MILEYENMELFNSFTKKRRMQLTNNKKNDIVKNHAFKLHGVRIPEGKHFRIVINGDNDSFFLGGTRSLNYYSSLFYGRKEWKDLIPIARHLAETVYRTEFDPKAGILCFYGVMAEDGYVYIYDCLSVPWHTVNFMCNLSGYSVQEKKERISKWRYTPLIKKNYRDPDDLRDFINFLGIDNVKYPEEYFVDSRLLPESVDEGYTFCSRLFGTNVREEDMVGRVHFREKETGLQTQIIPSIYRTNRNSFIF